MKGASVGVSECGATCQGSPTHHATVCMAQESGPHTHLLQEVGLLRSTGKRLNVGVQLAHLLQGPVSTLTVEGRHWHPLTAGGGKAEGGVHLGRGRVWSQQYTREESPTLLLTSPPLLFRTYLSAKSCTSTGTCRQKEVGELAPTSF